MRRPLAEGKEYMINVYCMLKLIWISFRKYHRGKRVRKPGVQWGLTGVEVDPVTGKTLAVDLQMLPYNRRDVDAILPRIVQRMKIGGTVTTDYWKAYDASVKAAGCTHLKVNHSKHFVNEFGVHTNNVEGDSKFLFSSYNATL